MASDIIGMSAKGNEDEEFSRVEDFTGSVESARMGGETLSTVTRMGMDDTLKVTPVSGHCRVAQKILQLDENKERSKGALRCDSAKQWGKRITPSLPVQVPTNYGDLPYFIAGSSGHWSAAATRAETNRVKHPARHLDARAIAQCCKLVENAPNVKAVLISYKEARCR